MIGPVLARARIHTAGAYVCIRGRYLFALGIQPHNDHIPIVRLGGHREDFETGWQCAVREVWEEASLQIEPRLPQTTYLYHADYPEARPSTICWQLDVHHEPPPFLVAAYAREEGTILSIMFLAHANGDPVPSSEVKGLVLLTETEIQRLGQEPLTLGAFLEQGGQALLNGAFDLSRTLEPFLQLRLLSGLFSAQRMSNTSW